MENTTDLVEIIVPCSNRFSVLDADVEDNVVKSSTLDQVESQRKTLVEGGNQSNCGLMEVINILRDEIGVLRGMVENLIGLVIKGKEGGPDVKFDQSQGVTSTSCLDCVANLVSISHQGRTSELLCVPKSYSEVVKNNRAATNPSNIMVEHRGITEREIHSRVARPKANNTLLGYQRSNVIEQKEVRVGNWCNKPSTILSKIFMTNVPKLTVRSKWEGGRLIDE